ncbi:MAG: COX15/CtaA family protein [Ilumatobacteraceae bacterium]
MGVETVADGGESPARRSIWRDGFTPRGFTSVAVAAIVLLGAIVVTGGAVRLTGSGLGCDDWPNCNESRFVDVSSAHAAIEQLNRLFTFLVGVGVALAAAAAWLRRPRRRDLRMLGTLIVAGVPAQGLVGAVVVWTDLNPAAVQWHFLLSMLLVWAAVLLLVRSREPDAARRRRAVASSTRSLALCVVVTTAITVVLGTIVTGTGPHAGDEGARRFFGTATDINGDALRWASRVHGASVWVTIAVVVALAWRTRRRADRQRLEGPLTAWMMVAVVQGAVGYTQYFAGLPVGLVIVHLAGATTLVGVTAWLWSATSEPDTERAALPDAGPGHASAPAHEAMQSAQR